MILLVAAAPQELGPLPGEVLGVGPVVAAATMARILAERQPDGVIMVGTAGSYPGGPALRTVIKARRVGLADGVAAMGLGYTPRPPVPLPADPRLLARVDALEADVLTVGAITTNMTLADRLSDGWQVEHLEAYAAACACAAVDVPFLAVLGIANFVGPDAHGQWLTHRIVAQDAARDAVARWLFASEETSVG